MNVDSIPAQQDAEGLWERLYQLTFAEPVTQRNGDPAERRMRALARLVACERAAAVKDLDAAAREELRQLRQRKDEAELMLRVILERSGRARAILRSYIGDVVTDSGEIPKLTDLGRSALLRRPAALRRNA